MKIKSKNFSMIIKFIIANVLVLSYFSLIFNEKSYALETATTQDPKLLEAYYNIPGSVIEEFNNMTDSEIEAKDAQIDNKYKLEEILDDKDTQYMVYRAAVTRLEPDYTSPYPYLGIGANSYKYVRKQLSKFGTTVTLEGELHQSVTSYNNSFRGDLKVTRNAGSLSKVKVSAHHIAYGVIGWNGKFPRVGQVYNGDVSVSKTTNLNTTLMDKTKNYSALMVFRTRMYAQAVITTSKGDEYTVTPVAWSRNQ